MSAVISTYIPCEENVDSQVSAILYIHNVSVSGNGSYLWELGYTAVVLCIKPFLWESALSTEGPWRHATCTIISHMTGSRAILHVRYSHSAWTMHHQQFHSIIWKFNYERRVNFLLGSNVQNQERILPVNQTIEGWYYSNNQGLCPLHFSVHKQINQSTAERC